MNNDTKKIGIDARLYFQTGVGTYLQNLLYELQKISPSDFEFYVYVMKNDSDKITFSNKQFVKKIADFKWHSISEQTGFLKILQNDFLDLMHFTYFSYPILYPWKFVSTIHDITPLLFKTGKASTKNPLFYNIKHLVYQYVLKNQILNSRTIIVPSQTIKNQIINLYGQQYEKKIIVTYEGINHNLIETRENKDLAKLFKKPFYVYVGNFYPHKNIKSLIKAFSRLTINAQLVLVGPNDFFANQMIQFINELNQANKILLYTTKDLSDLKFFYKHAIALIHPSLSEGFGLPLVEAAYFNCPIIASKIPVFKELLGESYVAFDPENINEMVDKIISFNTKPKKFNYLEVLKKFSFSQTAKKTLDVYQNSL